MKPPPPQDYTDDLESFFYVLCHIVFLFVAPGQRTIQAPSFLKTWCFDGDFTLLASVKVGFMLWRLPLRELPPYWGTPVKTLLQTFQKVLVKIWDRKRDIGQDSLTSAEQKRRSYLEVACNVDAYYNEVKDALFETIAQLEAEDPSTGEARLQSDGHAAGPPSPPVTASAASLYHVRVPTENAPPSQTKAILPSRKKRPSEGAEEDGKPKKRPCADIPSGSTTSFVAKSEREGNDVLF